MHPVDSFLNEYLNKNSTPCVQYCFFNSERIIHQFSGGLRDIKRNLSVNELTQYHAFSVTKTFTALAIMQLVENNYLQIEDSVKRYLPQFPYSEEITIKQLLSHSAGIPNPIPLGWIHLAQEHSNFARNHFFNQLFIKHKKVLFKPNQKFAYSNLGYVLLGNVIESISGISYENYITEKIIKVLPLNTNELGFAIPNNEQMAKGYQKQFSILNVIMGLLIEKSKYMGVSEGKWKPFKDYYINGVSYGGLIGTSRAFVKYIQELLKPDSKLIGDSYKKMLFEENYTKNNKPSGMCLSWFKGQLEGVKYYSHAGGGGGYYCELRIYPDINFGSVIMFNRTGITDERFLNKLDKYFISKN